jgi:hypothetical protein
LCEKCDDIIACAGSGHHFSIIKLLLIIKEMTGSVASGTHYITKIHRMDRTVELTLKQKLHELGASVKESS